MLSCSTIYSNLAGRANYTLFFTTCGEIRSFVMTGEKNIWRWGSANSQFTLDRWKPDKLVGLAATTDKATAACVHCLDCGWSAEKKTHRAWQREINGRDLKEGGRIFLKFIFKWSERLLHFIYITLFHPVSAFEVTVLTTPSERRPLMCQMRPLQSWHSRRPTCQIVQVTDPQGATGLWKARQAACLATC